MVDPQHPHVRTPRPIWLSDEEAEALVHHLACTAETDEPGPLRRAAQSALQTLGTGHNYAVWWGKATAILASLAMHWRSRVDMASRARAMAWMDPTLEVYAEDPDRGSVTITLSAIQIKDASDLMDRTGQTWHR